MGEQSYLRVVAKLAIFDGIAFQTDGFVPHRYLGDPTNICNVLSDQGCQEINLVFPKNPPSLDNVKRILSVSRAPTAVGGYGCDVAVVEQLLGSGAEKIILSDSLWSQPEAINRLASHIGKQAITVSIDYRVRAGCRYVVTGRDRRTEVGRLEDLLNSISDVCFGELILTCISRDGSAEGLDGKSVEGFSSSTPLLLCGGFDNDPIPSGVDGVVCSSSLFLYGQLSAPLTNYPQEHRVVSSV